MAFALPENLIWLWILPVVAILIVVDVKFRLRRLARFASTRLGDLLTGTFRPSRAVFRGVAWVIAVGALVAALARPRLGFEWRELPQGAFDVMVVLDLSKSMTATDLPPNRLERAKRELIDLTGKLRGDRLGIIGFGGVPFVHCPLTADYGLAQVFISQLSTDLMPVQGTALGDAIRLATARLSESATADSEGKAILLITDGEDHGSDPLGAAREAKEKGIKVFAIGIGGLDGAPVPDEEGGFKKDRSGKVVISKLDEEGLKRIALEAGGTYARSVTGDMDLDAIYFGGLQKERGAVQTSEQGATRKRVWYERFQWFVGLALLLLVLEFFIHDFVRPSSPSKSGSPGKWRKSRNLLVAALAALPLVPSDGWAREVSLREAEKAYEAKDYPKAERGFLDAEIEDPKNPQHPYNRGVAQFQNGDYDKAIQGFEKAARLDPERFGRDASFNAGNALVAKGDLEKAVEAYKQALQHDPEDQKSKENLQWTAKQIEQRKQQQQKGGDSDKNEKDQDGDQEDQGDKKDGSEKGDDGRRQDENQEQQSGDEDSEDQDGSPEQNTPDDKSDDENSSSGKKDEAGDEDQDAEGKSANDEEADKEDGDKEDGEDNASQAASQKGASEDEDEDQEGATRGARPMTPDEARALLESFEHEGSDRMLQPKLAKPDQPQEKDW